MKDVKTTPQIAMDLDKTLLDKLRKQTVILECYEGKIQALLQDRIDGNILEDEWQDKQDEMRKGFLRDFQELSSVVDINTPEIKFRNAIYVSMLERVKRYFGYFNAFTDVKTKITQYNMELNDDVLSIEIKDELKAISQLERVKFIVELAGALDISKERTDRIVNNVIDDIFGSRKDDTRVL